MFYNSLTNEYTSATNDPLISSHRETFLSFRLGLETRYASTFKKTKQKKNISCNERCFLKWKTS